MLRTDRIVFLTLWICSTGLNSSCVGLKTFPTDTIYEYSSTDKVCGVYKIANPETLTFTYQKDIPLNQCPSIFGFSDHDISPVLNWSRDAIAYGKTKCQQ